MTITHHLGAESLMSLRGGRNAGGPVCARRRPYRHVSPVPARAHLVRARGRRLAGKLGADPAAGGRARFGRIAVSRAASCQASPAAMPPIRFCCSPAMISKASAGGASVSVYGTGLCRCRARAHCSSSRRRPAPRCPIMATPACELTLVLRGALADASGRYGVGDIADLDEEVEHTPVADADTGCICAIANEMPTRFSGLLARLLQPWHGL